MLLIVSGYDLLDLGVPIDQIINMFLLLLSGDDMSQDGFQMSKLENEHSFTYSKLFDNSKNE